MQKIIKSTFDAAIRFVQSSYNLAIHKMSDIDDTKIERLSFHFSYKFLNYCWIILLT